MTRKMNKKTEHNLYVGSAKEELFKLSENSIQLIITSPPYWNARNYKHKKQIGFNDDYDEYLNNLNLIFQQCVKLLLPDGKIVLNIGNIYKYEKQEGRTFTVNLILDLWNILNDNKKLKYMGTIYWKKRLHEMGQFYLVVILTHQIL